MYRIPTAFTSLFLSTGAVLLLSAAPGWALPIAPEPAVETALEFADSGGTGAALASEVSVASAAAATLEQPGTDVAKKFQGAFRRGLGMGTVPANGGAGAGPAVPEPAVGLLLVTGLCALAARRSGK